MNRKHAIFVYGTLKNGFYFHDEYLGGEKSAFVGPATTGSEFTLYIDSLPHLIREISDKGVRGEVYEIDDKVLSALDKLEGHPNLYRREMIEVYIENDKKLTVWAYLRPRTFKGKEYAIQDYEFS